jgi:hypothetical protein
MESLQSLLSPNSNIKSTVAQAETAIKLMRTNGYNDQADLFENQIRDAIVNKNSKAFSGNVSQLFSFQKKAPIATPETKEQPTEYGSEELAMRIQDTLSLADERVVDLPNSSLSRLSSFVAKGDTKKASQQLGEISTFIDNALKTQTNETKETVDLRDGVQVQIGDQSGIRYIGGQPISKGAINSDVFNSMYQKNAASQQEQFAGAGVPMVSSIPLEPSQQYQVAPVEGVVAQPEVYAQGVQTAPTSMEEKQIAMRKASEAYKAGNDEEAVILMNAAGGKGLMGVFTTEDLSTVFGERGNQPPTETPKTELPSSIEVNGKTYNRPKGFTDQEWDEYIKANK